MAQLDAGTGGGVRPRRLLLLSHCVLNQNAVVRPLARSAGVIRSAVDWAIGEGFELFQLPCPEFRFAGPGRASASFDDYNTPAFHEANARLLTPVVRQLRRYRDAGYEIVGGLHVEGSPCCDPDTGNFVTDLLDACAEAGIEVRQLWQLPETATGEFAQDDPAATFGDSARRRVFPDAAASLTPSQVSRRARLISDGSSLPVRRGSDG